MKRNLKSFIIGVVASLGISWGIIWHFSNVDQQSSFSHAEVEEINPVLIVDDYTLLDPQNYSESLQFMLNELKVRNIMVMTPFGIIIPEPVEYPVEVNVIIQSGGGSVSYSLALADMLDVLRNHAIKVNCYVGEAQSAAFSLMVLGCDTVIAKKSAVIMEHRSKYVGYGTTPATFQIDNQLAKREAAAIGVDYHEWRRLTRGSEEDHVFTKEEIRYYGLVDQWME